MPSDCDMASKSEKVPALSGRYGGFLLHRKCSGNHGDTCSPTHYEGLKVNLQVRSSFWTFWFGSQILGLVPGVQKLLRWHLLATRELHASSQTHLFDQQAPVFKKAGCSSGPAAWSTGSTAPSYTSKIHSPAPSPGTLTLSLCLWECGTWCIQEAWWSSFSARKNNICQSWKSRKMQPSIKKKMAIIQKKPLVRCGRISFPSSFYFRRCGYSCIFRGSVFCSWG